LHTRDLDALATLMDSAVEIPGTRIKVGLDALLGVIPGLGDVASSLASLYILRRAHRLGVGRATLIRMGANVAADLAVGAIPLAGDIFDVFWKANRRNVALLQRHARATPATAARLRRSDRWFVGLAVTGLLGLAAASAVTAYYLAAWLVSAAGQFFQ
jgi:hypothetical protein